MTEEEARLDKKLARLARLPRYREHVKELCELPGVGRLTALVFLTEVGDLSRFANRRQLPSGVEFIYRIERILHKGAWTEVGNASRVGQGTWTIP